MVVVVLVIVVVKGLRRHENPNFACGIGTLENVRVPELRATFFSIRVLMLREDLYEKILAPVRILQRPSFRDLTNTFHLILAVKPNRF